MEIGAVVEQIGYRGSGEVTSFNQDPGRPERKDLAGRHSHVLERSHRLPDQNRGFIQVRGDHRSQGQQLFPQRGDRLLFKQPVTALRYHDRIYHQGRQTVAFYCFRHRPDYAGIGQHTRFHGVGTDIFQHRFHLQLDQLGRYSLERYYTAGVLGCYGSNYRGAIDPQSGKGFQVRLDSGPSSRIGSGYSERLFHFSSTSPSLSRAAINSAVLRPERSIPPKMGPMR